MGQFQQDLIMLVLLIENDNFDNWKYGWAISSPVNSRCSDVCKYIKYVLRDVCVQVGGFLNFSYGSFGTVNLL